MKGWLWLVLLCPALAYAQVYRWVDEQGQSHFSATPRPGAQEIKVTPQIIEKDAATQGREERLKQIDKARQSERAQAAKAAAERQAQVQQQCARWRAQLNDLQHSGRIFSQDAQGQRRYYSDAEVGAARARLAQQLATNCR